MHEFFTQNMSQTPYCHIRLRPCTLSCFEVQERLLGRRDEKKKKWCWKKRATSSRHPHIVVKSSFAINFVEEVSLWPPAPLIHSLTKRPAWHRWSSSPVDCDVAVPRGYHSRRGYLRRVARWKLSCFNETNTHVWQTVIAFLFREQISNEGSLTPSHVNWTLKPLAHGRDKNK